MKSPKTAVIVLMYAFAVGSTALPAWSSVPSNPGLSPAQVRVLVGEVSKDVDHADIIFANNPDPEVQRPYQDEFSKGLMALRMGDYNEAVADLRRADEIIRGIPEFAHLALY
jgi:hypothetical protein